MNRTLHAFCWFWSAFLSCFSFLFGFIMAIDEMVVPWPSTCVFISFVFATIWGRYC